MGSDTTVLSFLTTGPTFEIGLPEGFSSLPKLASPVFIHDTSGARSFYFLPPEQDGGVDALIPIAQETDGDGRMVAVYGRQDDPPQWWLRWTLPEGFLYTYLEESDGVDYAQSVCSGVRLQEASAPIATPFLLPESPLRIAVAPHIGYAETASFLSTSGIEGLTLRRPGFLEPGKSLVRSSGDQVRIRAGTQFGCELSVGASTLPTARAILDMALESFGQG